MRQVEYKNFDGILFRFSSLGDRYEFDISEPHNTADYIIFIEDGTVYAKNGRIGKIEFKGNDAKEVLQDVINTLDKGAIYIKQGEYYSNDISTPLTLKRNIQLIGEGYEITKLYFPIKLAEALNTLYGLDIVNPNLDKTGDGVLGEWGSGYNIDQVQIRGWEKGFRFAVTGAFGDIHIGRLRINNCKYAMYSGKQYHYYWFANEIQIANCDGFGQWNPQYSVINAINISNTGSILNTSIGGQATIFNVIYLENNSRVYFAQGGFGGFNACLINNLYVTSGSTAVFGNVRMDSYVNFLSVDSTSTLELWVDKIHIRAPMGISGTISHQAGKPEVLGVERVGMATITGDGTTTTFTVDVEHKLNIDDVSKIAVLITPSKPASVSYSFVDTDSDGFKETLRIDLSFSTAPASGEIVYISWSAHVVYA